MNSLRAGFNITPKITPWQLIMCLSSVYGPRVPVCSPYNVRACSWWDDGWFLGDLLPDLDQGISELLDSVALLGGGGYTDKYRPRGSQLYSGERESQSMASMPSSSRNRPHTLATWGRALCCTRRNPGPLHQEEPRATVPGGTQGPLHQEEPRAHCTRRNPGPTAPGGTQSHCTRRNPGPTAPGGTQSHCTRRNPGPTAPT